VSCCCDDAVGQAAEIAAAIAAAAVYRVKAATAPTHTISDADFPSASDPRPVLLVCTGVSSMLFPAGIQATNPTGPFVTVLQLDATVVTFGGSGGATLVGANNDTEKRSGGANTEQVVTRTAAASWQLAGRTQV
jgi:hypothetical protein